MGLEKHPVLVSVLVSKKLSGLGLGLGLEACGLDYNTGGAPSIASTPTGGTKLRRCLKTALPTSCKNMQKI